ncbi:MAG: dipeptidase [Gammaproteobacteria bacterium]|nr:dipeptidase [Gammaproteobacteria bacterium]
MPARLPLGVAIAAALVLAAPARAAEDRHLARALSVLEAAPLVDTHNDLPWVIREKFGGDAEGYDISVEAQYDTDIPRLREGKVGTQFWSVYVPSALSPEESLRTQLEQIDLARRMIAHYPDDLAYADSVADIERAESEGRIASLMGIEGGHAIANSLGALRAYYDLGVRYMTLTHFHTNDWADSATDAARHEGLHEFGKEVIREMNRLGMMVDLSHVSETTMHDVLDITEAPVMYSHSSARALTGHARNVPDAVLRRVAENGGVVMVTFIPDFVNEERRIWASGLFDLLKDAKNDGDWNLIQEAYKQHNGEPPMATLGDVADHIEHVAKVAGVQSVGIGGDFYGAEDAADRIVGLEDVSKYPDLIAELAARGWTDDDLRLLTRDNILRVFAEVERTAARIRRERPPSLKQFSGESAGR